MKKIVLAYSGGLDTSIILRWLQENYKAEIICYTADIGQEIDKKKIIYNAKKFGVKKIIIKDYLKDHRVFMTSAIAALSFGGEWHIHDRDSIKTSFPSFLNILNELKR